jgi:hypothetical protein
MAVIDASENGDDCHCPPAHCGEDCQPPAHCDTDHCAPQPGPHPGPQPVPNPGPQPGPNPGDHTGDTPSDSGSSVTEATTGSLPRTGAVALALVPLAVALVAGGVALRRKARA